ncbi:hypothetical protein [Streptomyces pinistramenti]|uniref:hypothetical protein n=1 Tax=Streptomyces pinistramenti TaxID=2884812 RepID=UPI001D060ED0|nr:hypothetical protein [Streptomyces pinistramenti]MCB5906459.1 hypothetical protein [Streptomyces pinistramenti]
MDEKTESDAKKKEKRIDLSVPQVAGSALAAAVAAFLAGQLGVYGTIIGAGVVSVVATTGGSVFQHLFRRTGEQLKEAKVTTRPKPRRTADTGPATRGAPQAAGPTMVLPTFDRQGAEDEVTSVAARRPGSGAAPGNDRTQLLRRADTARPPVEDDAATRMLRAADTDATRVLRKTDGADAGRSADRTQLVPRLDDRTVALGRADAPDAGDGGAGPEVPGTDEVSTATYGTRLRGWRRPALATLGIFVLSMGVVTGVELITGETPSGGKGTTLGNLTRSGGPHRDAPETPQTPDPGRSGDTGTGHRDGSADPTPDPSSSGDTGSGTGTGSGTDKGTPTPTPSDGNTPSSGPTTSPDPTASTGDGSGTGDGSTGQGDQERQTDQSGTQAPAPDAS